MLSSYCWNKSMEKFTVISGLLFLLADILAIASLVLPDWINTNSNAGGVVLGLILECQTIFGREQTCFKASALPSEWYAALVFLVFAITLLASTCGLIVSSHSHRSRLVYARWVAGAAICCLCHVGILFPIGFRQTAVGGGVYRLPYSWNLGSSYRILWVFTTILSSIGWCILMAPVRAWMLN